jgi:hypothetical protein
MNALTPASVMREIEDLLPGRPADPPALAAAYIRAAASVIARYDVAGSRGAQGILRDLGVAFAHLGGPLQALLARAAASDSTLAADAESTRQALAHAAVGTRRAADWL